MQTQTGRQTSFGFNFGVAQPATALAVSSTSVKTKDDPTMLTTTSSIADKANPNLEPFTDTDKKETDTSAAENVSLFGSKVQRTDKVFDFRAFEPILQSQWRHVEWTEEQKTSLMKTVSSHRPSCKEVTHTKVLLLGPVGSGKSSFISSVQSMFDGRVTNRAMVGSSTTSFTKKLQSFNIRGQKGEDPTRLVLCDIMGLGNGEMTGLTLHDILSVLKGHVPEGHKFSPDQPVRSETENYVKWPSLKDKIHCVVFVVDASKIVLYPKDLRTVFQQLRDHISDLGIHQVALLTHVDKICQETANNITEVYKSRIIRQKMAEAANLLGMSTSYIVPVKNYSSEVDLDVNTDVLLLHAVDHILQYADLYFQDNTEAPSEIQSEGVNVFG